MKIDEKKVFRKLKKKAKRKKKFSTVKFARIDNYVSEKINDENVRENRDFRVRSKILRCRD